MEYATHAEGHWEYPGYAYLNEPLMDAIITDGEEALISFELARQNRNETTDNISNHLKARGHWLYQKTRLIDLYESLMPTTHRQETASMIQACIHDLDEHFAQTFAPEDAEYPYEKLSGDELFREAILSSVTTARRVVAIDQEGLKSPRELMDYIALRHHILLYDLGRAPWDVNLQYWGAKSVVIDRLKGIVSEKITAADRELLENLAGATTGSFLQN